MLTALGAPALGDLFWWWGTSHYLCSSTWKGPSGSETGFAEHDSVPGTPQGTQTIRMAGAPEGKPWRVNRGGKAHGRDTLLC